MSPNGSVLASVIFTCKYDQGTIRNHILMKVANPWAHALTGPLVTQWGGGGGWGLCHFHPQSTSTYSKEHTQQWGPLLKGPVQSSTWLTPEGRRVGIVSGLISLTGMKMAGEQRPPLHAHTYPWVIISADKSEAWQARIQTLHKEITQLQQRVLPRSNVRVLLRGGKLISSRVNTSKANGTRACHFWRSLIRQPLKSHQGNDWHCVLCVLTRPSLLLTPNNRQV